MTNLLHTFKSAIEHAARVKSPCALILALLMGVAATTPGLAAIDNVATATGTFQGANITSNTSSQSVPVLPPVPAMSVAKSGTLNDDDGTPGISAGDTITYTFTVTNTGTQTLTNVVITDPLVPVITLVSGDLDSDSDLDVGEIWTYQGSYTITQPDIDTNGGGDGDIDNTVTVTTDELPTGITDDEEVGIDPNANFSLTKTGTYRDDDGIPGLSAGDTIAYTITLVNTGTVTLTGVTGTDVITQGARTIPLSLGAPTESLSANGDLNVGETWIYSPVYTITQLDIDNGGDLVNTVTIDTDQTPDQDGDDTQPIVPIANYTMAKSASLQDGDGDSLGDAGETVDYTFTFVNTGNATLTNLRVSDPLPGLSAILCGGDLDSDGDIDLLPPGLSQTCTATYTITTADVVRGFVENIATTSAFTADGITPVIEDDTPNDNETIIYTDTDAEIEILKSVGAVTRVLPSVYEFTYTIDVTNSGSVPQSGIQIADDLGTAINPPAELLGTPTITATGFAGTGGANASYDGLIITDLLSGDVSLAPGDVGQITITLRVDVKSQTFRAENVAVYTSNQNPAPVPSNDPTETPGDPDDQQPTRTVILDEDGDGARDDDEENDDRDNDGTPNPVDYDPTGHLYCQPSGRILLGGQITVTNLGTGLSQTGTGQSNGINILRDGADGRYQFYVTQGGRYRLSVSTLPGGAPISTTRPPTSPVLDVTSLLPANPGILGAGTDGAVTELTDFTEAANPYYFDFDIRDGDPSVFNNNIPFLGCGVPQLAIDKSILNGPTTLADGRSEITYQITGENTGSGEVTSVSLSDDLNATFGTGNFEVTELRSLIPPSTGTPITNPFYNGGSNIQLLTSGQTLGPDEVISLSLTVIVDVADGSYTNTASLTGEDPVTGLPVPVIDDAIVVDIAPAPETGELIVQKTTRISSARIGDVIPYQIVITNPALRPRTGIDFVDVMPGGFTYIPGTAAIDGVKVEPAVALRELRWANRTIAANSKSIITLALRVGAGTPGTEFINAAWVEDGRTGKRISNVSRAKVTLDIDPVLQCSDLIGRVFDDQNANGYHDKGEPGLPGVRLATVNGLLITTDAFGRYHIACDAIPNKRIGSNYILKLDTRTLPTGYRVTSENPRVVRLTRGKLTKLNFAAANLRVVRLGLEDKSFRNGSFRLNRDVLRDLASILSVLEEEPSVLKIIYDADTADAGIARQRLKSVEALIKKAWKAKDRPHSLQLEALLKR